MDEAVTADVVAADDDADASSIIRLSGSVFVLTYLLPDKGGSLRLNFGAKSIYYLQF